MTPIPDNVVAAIVAAGHSLSAEPVTAAGYGRTEWRWHDGNAVAPRWCVSVGSLNYRGDRGSASRATPREALVGALDAFAARLEASERTARVELAKCRAAYRKEQAKREVDAFAKQAADVRALAATVAAMWLEVSP